jgi:hypothetical protein
MLTMHSDAITVMKSLVQLTSFNEKLQMTTSIFMVIRRALSVTTMVLGMTGSMSNYLQQGSE